MYVCFVVFVNDIRFPMTNNLQKHIQTETNSDRKWFPGVKIKHCFEAYEWHVVAESMQ